MTYSDSDLDFNFATNSASDFDSTSESGSESESDFNSVLMNLDICIFFHPIFILSIKIIELMANKVN